MSTAFTLPDFVEKQELPKVKGRWSFSALMQFEQCPYKYFVEQRLGHRGSSGPAAERGSKIHDECEHYITMVSNDTPSDKKVAAWIPELEELRGMYADGQNLICEDEWAFDRDWGRVAWGSPDAWLRGKLDVFVKEGTSAHIMDWKTGRKFGNEMKHQQQGILYAIMAFMIYPELEFARVEFLYLDQPYRTNLEQTYTRDQALMFLPNFEKRVHKMLTSEIKAFAPPLTLDGLPGYLQDWLKDPANHDHENNPFTTPFYVSNVE